MNSWDSLGQIWIKLLWTLLYTFFLLTNFYVCWVNIYLEVELLSHRICTWLVSCEIARPFSKVMENYGNPTNNVKEFHLFHILTKIWCLESLILAILVGVQWFFFLQFYFIFPPIIFISWRLITLQYCSGFCHTLTWISHGFTCVPHPEPRSHLSPHPTPLGRPSAPAPSTCLVHPTWAGGLFHTWWYTCFNAVLSEHPTLAFSHRVQKSVLYICVSFSVLHIGSSLPFSKFHIYALVYCIFYNFNFHNVVNDVEQIFIWL